MTFVLSECTSGIRSKAQVKKKPRAVRVNDRMQKGYKYLLTKPIGKEFASGFKPQLTPKQMLRLGVFGGKYLTECQAEFHDDWFD